MALSRALGESGVAAAEEAKRVMSDEAWQSQPDRALAAAGSRHAAEAFHKVSRALRLTLKLEKATAEWLRDARLGLAAKAGGPPFEPSTTLRERENGPSGEPAPSDGEAAWDETERPCDVERAERLVGATFREAIDRLCGDLGAAVDWSGWVVSSAEAAAETPEGPALRDPAGAGPRRRVFRPRPPTKRIDATAPPASIGLDST